MSLYYNRSGEPLELFEWGALHSDKSYCRIAATWVPASWAIWLWVFGKKPRSRCWVSTVWLGLDHSFTGPPPLIFETMAFGGGQWNEAQDRYTTEDLALAGHKAMVAAIESGLSPEEYFP